MSNQYDDLPPLIEEGAEEGVIYRMEDMFDATVDDQNNPIVSEEMKKMIDGLLYEEAVKYDIDPEDVEISVNHVAEEVNLTEEDMAKIQAEQEASYAKAAEEEARKVEEAKKLEEKKLAEKKAQEAQSNEPQFDDDGFQIITKDKRGKRTKTKGPAFTSTFTSTSSSSSSNTTSSRGYRPNLVVSNAVEPEVRIKMPGDSSFPFCFVCSRRHDFGECE